MAKKVSELPPGYKAIGPVNDAGQGDARARAALLKDDRRAIGLLKQHFSQHAEPFPKDFSPKELVFRVVATVANTPQLGWETLIVEFGYRPRGNKKK